MTSKTPDSARPNGAARLPAGTPPGGPVHETDPAMAALLQGEIATAGGWLPFDRYMSLALYAPGLGYYANARRKFGTMPQQGSDFVTAPELSPLFGRALARQVAQALSLSGTETVIEFGAGSGALAEQLLETLDGLGQPVSKYFIVDLSGSLRARQAERLARFAPRVEWLDRWPDEIHGVLVANELLDAMPVELLCWDGARWLQRGVGLDGQGTLHFVDRPGDARPPTPQEHDLGVVPGTVTEIHPQAEAFMRTLAEPNLAAISGEAGTWTGRAGWCSSTAPATRVRRSRPRRMPASCRTRSPRSTRRPRPSCARWRSASSAARRSSSTTVSRSRSTTTRSAPAAR